MPGGAGRIGGPARRILVVGLTGGIATGKSTVAAMLGEWGAQVIDADQVARELVRPGEPGLAEVARHFGRAALREDGALDRARLGDLVFSSVVAREALDAILHRRIAARIEGWLAAVDREARGPEVAVVEAAVLKQAGWDERVDSVVVVGAKHSTQLGRLIDGHGFDEARALARVGSQTPPAELRALADHFIDTDGTLENTREQAAAIWCALQQAARHKFHRAAGAKKPAARKGKDRCRDAAASK